MTHTILTWYGPIGLLVLILMAFLDVAFSMRQDPFLREKYNRGNEAYVPSPPSLGNYFIKFVAFLEIVSYLVFWPVTMTLWIGLLRTGTTFTFRMMPGRDTEELEQELESIQADYARLGAQDPGVSQRIQNLHADLRAIKARRS